MKNRHEKMENGRWTMETDVGQLNPDTRQWKTDKKMKRDIGQWKRNILKLKNTYIK